MKTLLSLLFLLFTTVITGFSQSYLIDSTLSIRGYMEFYYSIDPVVKRSSEKSIFYNFRKNNEFSINLALVSLKYESARLRGVLSIQGGDYAQFNYAAEHPFFQQINEAWAGAKIGNNLWIDAGIFPSHIGYESAIGRDNWHLTMSIAAENMPYFETGFRANYKINDKMAFNTFLLNGWQRIRDNNNWPALGTQFIYQPSNKILLNYSTFLGNEQPDGFTAQTRFLNDFYTYITLSERASILGAIDFGIMNTTSDGTKSWYNATLSGKYRLLDWMGIAGRIEYYNDANQLIISTGTPDGLNTIGGSANLDIAINNHLLYRMEARYFHAANSIIWRDEKLSKDFGFYTGSLSYNF